MPISSVESEYFTVEDLKARRGLVRVLRFRGLGVWVEAMGLRV